MTRREPEPGSWGYRFRKARRSKRWRQGDIATKLGVTYFTVGKWELGDSDPLPENVDAIEKLGGAFKALAREQRAEGGASAERALRVHLRALQAEVERLSSIVDASVSLLADAQAPALRDQLLRVLAGDPR